MRKMEVSGLEKNSPARRRPWRYEGSDLMLSLRVQPGAGKTEPAGRYGEVALRLRLAAPAHEGKANRACIRFLAKALGVPPASVTILHGQSSRDKLLRIADAPQDRCKALLAAWIS